VKDGRTAIILCGGRSSRFGGGDKALAAWNGRTLLASAMETAGAVADEILLAVGPVERYVEFGCPIVTDMVVDRGPLAGIVAGLERAKGAVFIVLAVDLPLVTPDLLETLLAELSGADLVMPRTQRGLEPLCCVGLRAPCLAAGRELLGSENPAPQLLMDRVKGREFQVEGTGMDGLFLNVNTLEELARAKTT
jgi:molybdopterin-guanine dinucleotide biosynthesis protein A